MRTVFCSAVLAACVLMTCLSTGCRLCCAPYDYCGPVWQCGGCADLSTRRCGSGVCGPACGPCGATNNMAYVQNPQNPAQMVPGTAQPMMPAQPTTAIPGPQVQFMQPVQQAPMVRTQAPVQPQMMPMQPQVGAQIQPQMVQAQPQALPRTQVMTATATQTQVQPQAQIQPQPQTMVVPQQGVIEVQVFDEKGNFLGIEKMDANGNTLNHVPHPVATAVPQQPMQQQMMMVPQQQVMYAPRMNYQPVSMNGGGWKTRTQPR